MDIRTIKTSKFNYMQLMENKRFDGTKAEYLNLAQNYWVSDAQRSKAKIIYSFGRKNKLDDEVFKIAGGQHKQLSSTLGKMSMICILENLDEILCWK